MFEVIENVEVNSDSLLGETETISDLSDDDIENRPTHEKKGEISEN